MVKLLHDHLRSSLGVMVESVPLPISMFTPPPNPSTATRGELSPGEGSSDGGRQDNSPQTTSPPATSRHSPIVPLDYLHEIFRNHNQDSETKPQKPHLLLREMPTKTSTETSLHEVSILTDVSGHTNKRDIVCLPVSPYMAFDATHSCNECSKYVRGSPLSPAEFLTSILPPPVGGRNLGGGGQGGGRRKEGSLIKWCIPVSQQKHCVINNSSKILERLKLPMIKLKGEKSASQIMTPVFTPTLGRESSGLFNLFHGQFYNLHVLVTSDSEFGSYCKAWPNHIVMALPDKAAMGWGKRCLMLKGVYLIVGRF